MIYSLITCGEAHNMLKIHDESSRIFMFRVAFPVDNGQTMA